MAKATIQQLTNSRFAIGLALGAGRLLPPRLGYSLARQAAKFVASRRKEPLVRAVRANQWVISQERLSAGQLDQVVGETIGHAARCLYDLYHNLNNHESMTRLMKFSPATERLIEQTRIGGEAMVIVGVHMSNFDFVMRAAALQGLNVLGIAVAESSEHQGYEWQNELRRSIGLNIMPASVAAVRAAIARLQAGGAVLTGLDRPLPQSKYHPRFFGRPAPLSVVHIHLALKVNAPVVVVGAIMQDDQSYVVETSEPILMERHSDRRKETLQNAERVLAVAEKFICRAPHQWSMFYPVWPEALAEMP